MDGLDATKDGHCDPTRSRWPAGGVWLNLFEPVYTGGRPNRTLGDLGTREG